MDANRFDALSKTLGAAGTRRGVAKVLGGLTTGALFAPLLGRAESEAKHKKHKKHKKHGGDKAPPCTSTSCPLPPGCSPQGVDDCTAAFQDALLPQIEPCRSPCANDPTSPACQSCLLPILDTLVPDAEACLDRACGFPPSTDLAASSTSWRVAATADAVHAEAWWQRKCGKACCFTDLHDCWEDVRDTYYLCLGTAAASCLFGPACLVGLAGCAATQVYLKARCQAKFGCQDGGCCIGSATCTTDCLCPSSQKCGSNCCPDGWVCCNNHCYEATKHPSPCGDSCCVEPWTKCCCDYQCQLQGGDRPSCWTPETAPC